MALGEILFVLPAKVTRGILVQNFFEELRQRVGN